MPASAFGRDSLSQKHAIPVAEEPVAARNSVTVGRKHVFATRKSTYQHQQARLGQMEIRQQPVDQRNSNPGEMKISRCAVCPAGSGPPLRRKRGSLKGAHYRCAHGDDAPAPRTGPTVYGFGRCLGTAVLLGVQSHFVDPLHAQRRKCAQPDVQRDARDLHTLGGAARSSIWAVKCRPAVGAATEPRSRAKTVW